MDPIYQKICIIASCILLVIRFIEGKHLLHSGVATGRMVNMQDSVIESCRGHFMCKVFPFHNSLGLTCLHARYVCDGIQHCEQGEDELPSECGGKGGHGGSGVVVYNSHSDYHGEELPFDYGGEYSHNHGGHGGGHVDGHKVGNQGEHGGKKSGSQGGSNRQVIVIQQPPPQPAPKKHRTIARPQAVPVPVLPQPSALLPAPIAPPVLPPRLISPFTGLGPLAYGGLGGLGGFGGLGGGLGALALREAMD